MNHDYAHCADFKKDCPKDCFRAQLVRDLDDNEALKGAWISWINFRKTDECILKENK